MPNGLTGYRRTARLFHWGIALLVLLMIPAGLVMTTKGLDRAVQDTLFLFHKNAGVLIFFLVLARLIYRLRHAPPPLPATMPAWQRRAADLSHKGLYALLLLMPVFGYVRVRAGRFPIEALDALGIGTLLPKSDMLANTAKALHYAGALALIALLGLHIAAALQHALIRRDGVWSRMWPPLGTGREG